MNVERKVSSIQDTGSVAPIFRLDAGLRHNFKQGVPVHFEIWAVCQTAGSDTADKGHSAKRCKFTITFAPWLGPQILFTDQFRSVRRFSLNFRKSSIIFWQQRAKTSFCFLNWVLLGPCFFSLGDLIGVELTEFIAALSAIQGLGNKPSSLHCAPLKI